MFISRFRNRLTRNPNNLENQSLKQPSFFSKREMVLTAAIFAAIGGYGLWWGVASPSVVARYEANQMKLPGSAKIIKDGSASYDQAVKLTQNGTISHVASLNQTATSLTVVARGEHCGGKWPKMKVMVGNTSSSFDVKKKSWKNYTLNTPPTKGSNSIDISLENAHSSKDCNRALYIDRVTFYGHKDSPNVPPGTTPPIAPLAPAVSLFANPSSVTSGSASSLTWVSKNTTTCTASGDWSGAKATSGIESTGPLTASKTYTLTCTGNGGAAFQTVNVTVTVPAPAPAPPRPTTPPAPPVSGSCSINNATGCVPGTTLTFTDAKFLCNKALSGYGKLPIKVVVNFTPGKLFGENGAIDLYTGCAGDGNPNTIDLIVDVKGDGRTYGPGVDAFKVRLQAGYNGGIQVTGTVQCGPKYTPSQHADGVQAQGGRDITFVDFNVGNYDAGTSTCQGAGGAMFYSSAGGTTPQNMKVIRGKYIACNHSLLAGTGTGEVNSGSFRSGRTDGSDPVCVGYAASNPCIDESAVVLTNNTCQRWSSGRWQ